jgi:hypothetical protein
VIDDEDDGLENGDGDCSRRLYRGQQAGARPERAIELDQIHRSRNA